MPAPPEYHTLKRERNARQEAQLKAFRDSRINLACGCSETFIGDRVVLDVPCEQHRRRASKEHR